MTDTEKTNPFDGPQMQNGHYQRADMSGTNFDGVNLENARFFAVLANATFTDTNLSGAEFDDINLSGSRFHNVNLSGSTITYANLSGLRIDGATMENAAIENANLEGMTINGVLITDLFAAYEARKP